MIRIIAIITLLFSLSACEKKVDFTLKNASELLSVDASIGNGEDPVVILSKSLNYFSKVSAAVLSQAIIKDAEVFLSQDNKTHKLRRYDINLPGNIPFSFYSTDPTNPSTIIEGELGKQYSLKIVWKGQEYNSITTIPQLKKTIDSLWWVKAPNKPDTSTQVVLRAKVTDPPGFGDYIRYFTSVNNADFLPGFNSVFDDLLVNGTSYNIDIDRGVDRNAEFNQEDYGFFRKGDTVTVKLSNIDKATFDFWRTLEFSLQSTGNPFSSPTKIIGNISNGALGYFGGYANQFRSIIIPK